MTFESGDWIDSNFLEFFEQLFVHISVVLDLNGFLTYLNLRVECPQSWNIKGQNKCLHLSPRPSVLRDRLREAGTGRENVRLQISILLTSSKFL